MSTTSSAETRSVRLDRLSSSASLSGMGVSARKAAQSARE
jgi:hypothetical protein